MNEDQLRHELASLPPRLQVAILTCYVEHVLPICGKDEIIDRALELAWNFVANGDCNPAGAALVSEALDISLDEDSPGALIHAAAAAELLVMSPGRLGSEVVNQILNNIEATIDVADPKPRSGIIEEQHWQVSVLERARRLDGALLGRASFASLADEHVGWYHRLVEDGWL